ncbi:MAG: nucleoside monophosphate kinase [bacterium]
MKANITPKKKRKNMRNERKLGHRFPKVSTAIILIASPGGGKGTTEEGLDGAGFRVHSLPFRKVLDEEKKKKTPMGNKIEFFRTRGRLVPIEIMRKAVKMAFQRIPRDGGLIILDGLPRDRSQIDLALEGLEKFGVQRKIVLHLECDPILAACRIMKRARNKMDKDPYLVAGRMREFDSVTKHVVSDFREHKQGYGVEFVHYNTNNLKREFPNLLRILNL